MASGLTSSSYVDSGGLLDGVTYYYRVQALERSTGVFDGNFAEVSGSPTGPGTGLNTIFAEDFENSATLTQWTDTVSPGSRTCGLWTDSVAATSTETTARQYGSRAALAITDERHRS